MKVLEEELMSLKNKIQTKGSSVSAQVRNQWIDEATAKERAYKRKGEDYQQLGQKRLAEVTQPVYDRIFKFLDSYCQQRGIVLVVEENSSVQAGILIWHNPSTNITDDFIKEYNKANPVAGGAGTKNP
jgi:outer membrane protein